MNDVSTQLAAEIQRPLSREGGDGRRHTLFVQHLIQAVVNRAACQPCYTITYQRLVPQCRVSGDAVPIWSSIANCK